MLTLRKIENVPTGPNNRPKLAVKITGASLILSGVLGLFDFVVNCRMWRDVSCQGVRALRHFLSVTHMVLEDRQMNKFRKFKD
jgi:hypothetical protein